MAPSQRRVLIVGGGFAGLCCGRDLADHFLVTIVDAKEFFEYTPGVLRAYVKPKHFDALSFTLQPVIEAKMGCKYIWGEVKKLNVNGVEKTAVIKPIFADKEETIDFDYCIIASGCNFGPFHKWGESLWFPTIHEAARPEGSWPHLDERFIEGRRRHIFEEYAAIKKLNDNGSSCLIVGAGFIGVEWATELNHFFPNIKLTITDMLPLPLGPLPEKAAVYCKDYMEKAGIKQVYKLKFNPDDKECWQKLGLEGGVDKQYVCIGVKASNWFMPKETLSVKGLGGGGWILMNHQLAVKTKDNKVWCADERGHPRVFAIGDCNYACIVTTKEGVDAEDAPKDAEGKPHPENWPIPPIAKISYPGEEEAIIACRNITKIDKMNYLDKTTECWTGKIQISDMHWPWGAGMFATSLGPHDACFVAGANWNKGSGCTVTWGGVATVQKEIIEASKVNESRHCIWGRLIWHFVHHTPIHLWGNGPLWGY